MTQTFGSAAEMIAALQPEDPVHCLRPRAARTAAAAFVTGFPGTVMYAVKCNPDRRLLRALVDGGVRHFDTASLPEIEAVNDLVIDDLSNGQAEPVCHFMHPVKSRRAIGQAYHRYGVRSFVLDHPDELAKVMEATGRAPDLDLFVRMATPRKQAVCDLGGKFGIDGAEFVELLRRCRPLARRLGIAFHVGSQCLSPSAYARSVALAGQGAGAAGVSVDLLDVGGGFPVRYQGVTPPDWSDYFSVIDAARRDHGFTAADLYCEPGRALVADAMSIVARVELRRGDALHINDGVYGGLSEFRFEGIHLPVRRHRLGGAPDGAELMPFRLFGPTCDPVDSMPGPHWLPADVAEGDYIEIGQTGAYSTCCRTGFNGFYSDRFVFLRDAPFHGIELPASELREIAAA